jgi:hypothetical protein
MYVPDAIGDVHNSVSKIRLHRERTVRTDSRLMLVARHTNLYYVHVYGCFLHREQADF